VARYGKDYKDRVVARLLPPESAPVERVSSEVGVSAATLERWLAEALEAASGGEPPRRVWTAAARLQAVIATAALNETAKSAWCREQGVYAQELAQWSASALGALADPGLHGLPPEQRPVLHGDNGATLKATTVLATLHWLKIRPSYSRPRVSDDNAFVESLFRTAKYRPEFPASGPASSCIGTTTTTATAASAL
jgi:transposase InsO family protein